MESSGKNMEKTVTHLQAAPRAHRHALPVAALFYEERKARQIDRVFGSCNFSFLLAGRGFYRNREGHRAVAAPCVFIQRPGVHHEYGPDGTWAEFSILYQADLEPRLVELGYLRRRYDFWPIINLPRLQLWIDELLRLRRGEHGLVHPDRIDRLADLLICESLRQRPAPELSPAEAKAEALRLEFEANPAQPLDLNCWLEREGLSESTFRRCWARLNDLSPARYLQGLRHREACRLLIETSLPVKEIAGEVGYEDALYFSRLFRQLSGTTPTAYRRQHQGLLAAFEETH